jgi:hypothetical protein
MLGEVGLLLLAMVPEVVEPGSVLGATAAIGYTVGSTAPRGEVLSAVEGSVLGSFWTEFESMLGWAP